MINESVAIKIFNDLKDKVSNETQAYGIYVSPTEEIECVHLVTSSDVYVMAEELVNTSFPDLWDHILIVTHGWASPYTEEDVPPSKHPERKRVSVYSTVSSDQTIATVLYLHDEEPFYDTTGTGNMADAIRNIYSKRNNKNTTIQTLGILHESDEDLFS